MITLNHVLVPHDFGDTSKTAMDYAIALAWMFDAVLDVLHVRDSAETVIPAQFPREFSEELEATVRERLLRITVLDETKPTLDFHLALRSGACRNPPLCEGAADRSHRDGHTWPRGRGTCCDG